MRNIVTVVLVAVVAFLGLVNAALINAGKLPTYNTAKLRRNNDDGNPTLSNVSESSINCYSTGAEWGDLGNWQEIFDALQISGVMRVDNIPAGHHISDKVPVGPHCYVYEVGINKGYATPSKEDYNKGLEMVYICKRGGKQSVNFSSSEGEIIGSGWVKGDPQTNPDCS
ncbi:hypothetical protein DHEL01_v201418 [Diaporthe helianthi]|uniref:Ecp2 effector protein domain-containing protein n=1 Tax=Diaporthe helianthi TaxID=158607 RepID=A0A2P5ICG7_DIAHE|nr:hypothetical protein DHEL01_v201418 [Diaporthe helianthi]